MAEAEWEAHRRYADVQYILEGAERMGHALLHEGLAVKKPYDEHDDAALFDAHGSFFRVGTGEAAIFLPHDIHAALPGGRRARRPGAESRGQVPRGIADRLGPPPSWRSVACESPEIAS